MPHPPGHSPVGGMVLACHERGRWAGPQLQNNDAGADRTGTTRALEPSSA